jgi:signal peptidase I
MTDAAPPALPQSKAPEKSRRAKFFIGIAVLAGVVMFALAILRAVDLIRPFKMPTSSMAPTIKARDHVMMEGIAYKGRNPRRGEIVVFRTFGIATLPQDQIYAKRVVGLPGDTLRIADGKLLVNGDYWPMMSSTGAVHHVFLPWTVYLKSSNDTISVPAGQYFVLGDYSANSADSRSWGCVPRENIMGKIMFCYWPPTSIGSVR